MRLVTVFAFTENVTVREKDSSMSSEMNVSLLLSYFAGNKMVGGVMMAMSRGRRNVRFLFKTLVCSFSPHEIEQNREKVRARRSGNVTVLTDKNMGFRKWAWG